MQLRRWRGPPFVTLVAGGWSFHALTSEGRAVGWGQLNGEEWSPARAGLRNAGVVLDEPNELAVAAEMDPLDEIEAGRSHVVARSPHRVYEWRSWGRIWRIRDNAWCGRVKTVAAGWTFSAAVDSSDRMFIWFEQPPAHLLRLAREAGERASSQNDGPRAILADLEVETLMLPRLPPTADGRERVVDKLACGDHFVFALTGDAQVFAIDVSPVLPARARPGLFNAGSLDPDDGPSRSRESLARLEAAFASGDRTWHLRSKFCDMERVRELTEYQQGHVGAPPPSTRINHISAHFKTLAVYSVPSPGEDVDSSGSVVLLGDESSETPRVMADLQGRGVIKVAQGDYHWAALTQEGALFTWGAFSKGALGLGHPSLRDTPLSDPEADAGGVSQRRPAALARPPAQIETPTRVRFRREQDEEEFVYDVCAGGWHTGVLAINTRERLEDDGAESVELSPGEQAEPRPSEDESDADGSHDLPGAFHGQRGSAFPFRLGFPARGAFRGVR